MGFVTWWSRTPRTTTERLQGKRRKHHILLPSIVVHHKPHSSHLRVGLPLLPTQAVLVGPVSIPWSSLSVPSCPTAHLTLPMGFSFPLLHPCTVRAPKAKIYSLLCSAKLPLGHFPILYKDTVWPPALHVGWPHHHISSPSHVSSSLPWGQRWKPSEASALGGGLGHQKACWIDLTWGSAWAFCRVLKGSFVLFLGPHIFLCAIGQAAPLCYRSCDADRDEALSRSLGCVWLCTPRPVGQFAIICIMGPIVPLQAWIKCPVCVHACTRVQRTPLGDPSTPVPKPGCHWWHCALASLT